jgi:hypothetical protein
MILVSVSRGSKRIHGLGNAPTINLPAAGQRAARSKTMRETGQVSNQQIKQMFYQVQYTMNMKIINAFFRANMV